MSQKTLPSLKWASLALLPCLSIGCSGPFMTGHINLSPEPLTNVPDLSLQVDEVMFSPNLEEGQQNLSVRVRVTPRRNLTLSTDDFTLHSAPTFNPGGHDASRVNANALREKSSFVPSPLDLKLEKGNDETIWVYFKGVRVSYEEVLAGASLNLPAHLRLELATKSSPASITLSNPGDKAPLWQDRDGLGYIFGLRSGTGMSFYGENHTATTFDLQGLVGFSVGRFRAENIARLRFGTEAVPFLPGGGFFSFDLDYMLSVAFQIGDLIIRPGLGYQITTATHGPLDLDTMGHKIVGEINLGTPLHTPYPFTNDRALEKWAIYARTEVSLDSPWVSFDEPPSTTFGLGIALYAHFL